MLPGGMTVLGLFFVGDIKLFSNSLALNCLKNIISAVDKFTQENEFYFLEPTVTPKIVLNYIDDAKYFLRIHLPFHLPYFRESFMNCFCSIAGCVKDLLHYKENIIWNQWSASGAIVIGIALVVIMIFSICYHYT